MPYVDGKKKRRRMKKLRLDEISWVDRPAQEPARMAIMKRDSVQKRLILTTEMSGHAHMIVGTQGSSEGMSELRAGQTSMVHGHVHDWVVDDVGNIRIGDADGHSHGIGILIEKVGDGDLEEEKLAGLLRGVDNLGEGMDDSSMTKQNTPEGDAEKGIPQEQFEAMQKRAERAEAVAKLSTDERTYFDGLDTGDQDKFLAKSDKEREAIVKNAQDENSVVYTAEDGTEFRKSDDTRLVQMAKDRDADRAELRKQREQAETAQFEKRATEELGHLKGETSDKAVLLKSVEGIEDEEQRGRILEILKSQDAGIGKAMTRVGHKGSGSEGDSAEAKIAAMAKKRAAEKGISEEKAYMEVLESSEGQELHKAHYGEYVAKNARN